jgi:hypothetical protein
MAIEGSEQGDAENPAPEAERAATPAMQVRAAVVKRINLADFQNSVPALLELAVVNETAQEIRDLRTLCINHLRPCLQPRR